MRSLLMIALTCFACASFAEEQPRPAIASDLAPSTTLVDITSNGKELIAVGQRGHIVMSADGTQWTRVIAPHNSMLNKVRFRSPTEGWAVGHDNVILGTRDGGKSWDLQYWDAEGRSLNEIIFMHNGRIAAIGAYGAYIVSDDNGKTWTPADNVLVDLGAHLSGGIRLKNGQIVIVGERSLIARSDDNGDSWTLVHSPYEGSLFGVLPYGPAGIMAFGMRGNVYISEDIANARTIAEEDFDPFSAETVEDETELAEMGWINIPAVTIESLFGGRWKGKTALLIGVNGTAVRVDPANRTQTLIPTNAEETLGNAIWFKGQWIAVGRRGVQPLGTLSWN